MDPFEIQELQEALAEKREEIALINKQYDRLVDDFEAAEKRYDREIARLKALFEQIRDLAREA